MVASHLWAKDISAEYLPHSGVILSLLRKIGGDSMVSDTAEWTVDQLCDLCCVSTIVILQFTRTFCHTHPHVIHLITDPSNTIRSCSSATFTTREEISPTSAHGEPIISSQWSPRNIRSSRIPCL
jgi:hypothetical protein